eukprot:TRINITY_DN2463_c0_g2_i2.p1 TRINITY_DN2463_c0_g2~~TRINITY_DN2463_c0_g2_i2.p1  ORF type:complete len:239 (-),score=51.79 TRINITY_DN2463_c0_g2_i2:202-918(-)
MTQFEDIKSSMMVPMKDQAAQILQMEFEGVTVEEGAKMLPEIINQTFATVILQNYEKVSIGSAAGATIEGLLNTTSGEDMMKAFLEDASNYAQLISMIIGNFGGDCSTQDTAILWDTIDTMLSPIFFVIPIEKTQDIITQVAVLVANQFGSSQGFVDILSPLTAIELDSLLAFLPPDAGEMIDTLLGGLIQQFLDFPDGAVQAITNLINSIQSAYALDTGELIARAQDVASQIVEELN